MPRRRDPVRTREKLLESATKEFADLGFSGARVERIARRARVDKQLIYHYFGSKRALYQAVLERLWDRLEELDPGGRDHPTTLDEWLSRRVPLAYPEQWEQVRRLTTFEALEPRGRMAAEERRQKRSGAMVAELADLQQRGHLVDDVDARVLYVALQALLLFPTSYPQVVKLAAGVPPTDEHFTAEYRRLIERLVAGLAPPPD